MRHVFELLLHDPKVALSEAKYWYVIRPVEKLRPWLATKLPKWLVTDALIHAHAQAIRDDEVVGEASFIDIYGRWYREGRRK